MSIVFPAHKRPGVPSQTSLQWGRPIRAEDAILFFQGASTLLATRGMTHIVRTVEHDIAGDWSDHSHTPFQLEQTHQIYIPHPHPMARQLIVCVEYFAHDGTGEVTDAEGDGWDFSEYIIETNVPRIRMKLTTAALGKVDPPAVDEWAIEATTENGFIPSEFFVPGTGNAQFEKKILFCASGSEEFPDPMPTGPRRLNYGGELSNPLVLTVDTRSVRVLSVTVLEAPRLIIDQS